MSGPILRRSVLDGISFATFVSAILTIIVHPTREQMLNLPIVAGIFLISFLVGCLVSQILNSMGIKTLGQNLFEPDYEKAKAEAKAWYRTFWGWHLFLFILVLFVVGINKTKFSVIELLDQDGFAGASRLFKGLFSPNWSILPTAVYNIIETVFMAFLATMFAIPVAFILSFMSAKNVVMGRPVSYAIYFVLKAILNLTRSIEALVWAIIFSVWVGIGPFAGMLALMIHSIASLTKQYAEMVENVSDGPIEGVRSCGANKLQTIWFAIVPQVILPYISFTVYRWDINVRMATIIGLVGGGGIGTMLIQYQGQAMWSEVGTIIFVIAIVVWAMDLASSYIREALK
ncbi:MAG: phosphonate ABC transporter, permease protein PhnE [Bdellovibrio sp.]|nr:phosphonate ABC transporter, permease protein PhnE [Bdellovibrio sp.]